MIKVTKGDENLDSNDGLYTKPKQKPNKQERGGLEQPHSRSLPLPRIPLLFLLLFTCHSFNLLVTLSQMPEERKKKNLTPSSLFSLNRKTTQQKRKTTPFSRKATTSSKLFFLLSLFSLSFPPSNRRTNPIPWQLSSFYIFPVCLFLFAPFLSRTILCHVWRLPSQEG